METIAISALAALIGVPLVMAVVAKRFPARHPATGKTLEELRREFAPWYQLTTVAFIVGSVPLTYLWWVGFRALGAARAELFSDAEMVLSPLSIVWFFPALLAGMLSTGPILTIGLKTLLRDRYEGFVRFQDSAFRLDSRALERPFYIGMVVAIAMGVFLVLDWYAYVSGSELVHDPFFGLSGRRYPLEELREIRTAPAFVGSKGERVERREYVLLFEGERKWTTRWGDPSDAPDPDIARFVDIVSSRSGIPVTEVELLDADEL